jgi:SAM-dependent methyltransferase
VRGYREDLAYVHDAGFRDYALNAAPGLLRILRGHGVNEGLVVDLGCGSGRWAAELNRSGYDVLGLDQSPAMIQLARRIAPSSQFRIASLWSAKLPPCDGITSIGECLNYCFDAGDSHTLFRRVFRALRSGGVLVFDIAGPDRLPKQMPSKKWIEGRDWAILVTVSGNRKQNILQRQIICYRKIGSLFRRSEETHKLRLYRTRDLLGNLARCGFQAREISGYGRFHFPAGISGILAIKP